MMQRLLRTPLVLLLRRIVVLYGILLLCRVLFYVYNRAMIGSIGWSEFGTLLCGSLRFDTRSILYADTLFILLSLLPFECCCSRAYQRMLFWYYTVVNFLLIVAANLVDTVLFHHAHRRLAAPDLLALDGGDLPGLFRLAGENWPLLVAAAALLILLMGCFGRCDRCESILNPGWSHRIIGTIIFLGVAALCTAGLRGGFRRDAEPLAPADVTRYTAHAGKARLIQSNPFCLVSSIDGLDLSGRKEQYEPPLPATVPPQEHPDSLKNRRLPEQDGSLHRLRQLHRAYDTDD